MATEKPKTLFEPDVRALRDMVYGVPSTDKNWDSCKEHWMTPEGIKWLQEQIKKENKRP